MRRTGAIVLCLAAAMFATSCGGNASKKQAADGATETKTEAKAPAKVAEAGWESNDYTKQVPKPDIAIMSAGESGTSYGVNFNNATLEQVKAYAAKVKAAGFDKGASENDGERYYFNAGNAAGWNVMIMMNGGQSMMTITKPR